MTQSFKNSEATSKKAWKAPVISESGVVQTTYGKPTNRPGPEVGTYAPS
jgi:hypothetical protein